MENRIKTCVPDFDPAFAQSLMLPWSLAREQSALDSSNASYVASYEAIVAPPNALQQLGAYFNVTIQTVADRQAFLDDIQTNAQSIAFGGIFIDQTNNNSLLAHEATTVVNGPTLLNLISNVRWASAVGANGGDVPVVAAYYMPFPARSGGQLDPMKWVC